MNEKIFCESYADARLSIWWQGAHLATRNQLLSFLQIAHSTPLAKADQYTVGEYTGQPDRWKGARLVFAIKNGQTLKARAVMNSFLLSIGLREHGLLDATFIGALGPDSFNVRERQTLTLDQFTASIEKRNESIESIVTKATSLQKINGRIGQRSARWPRAYDIGV